MPHKHPHLAHPQYRPDIDGLRAVAILSVVGFHAAPGMVAGGFIGVDIFFVISGFLISTIIFSSLGRDRFSLVEFYVRRIRRIFPALILVLTACLAFGWYALLADEYRQLGKHTAAGAGFIQNFILYGESGYFDNSAATKPLLHLWSLAIEEQFYIFWPLLLTFVWKRQWSFLKITAAIAAISFAANIYLMHRDPTADFYLPIPRFWELMVGSVLAYVALHRPQLIALHKNGQSILGFLLVLLGLLLVNKTRDFPGWWSFLPTLGAFLIISAGPNAWLNEKLLSNRLMVWIGLISYPLYLWHWPLLSFEQIMQSEYASRHIKIAAVVLSIVLAWITYRFVEKPIRFGRNRKITVVLLLVSMIVIGFLGYQIHSKGGLPARVNLKNIVQISEGARSSKLNVTSCSQFGMRNIQDEDEWGLHCAYSSTGSHRTIAVFGDSHASAAFAGIAEILHDHSINTLLLASWGCPQFIGATISTTEQRKVLCANNTNEAINAVLANREIEKVFIISRGPFYFTSSSMSPFTLNDYVVAIQKTVDVFHNAGKRVYYVTENPELGFPPGYCTSRPFRISQEVCALEKKNAMYFQYKYLSGLRGLKNVMVIDTLKLFCPGSQCEIFHSGELLYHDSNHLSVAGSRFQADAISTFLLE
ncbi:MAG: acyltransferase family protein [Methylobacter sp.]